MSDFDISVDPKFDFEQFLISRGAERITQFKIEDDDAPDDIKGQPNGGEYELTLKGEVLEMVFCFRVEDEILYVSYEIFNENDYCYQGYKPMNAMFARQLISHLKGDYPI